MPTQTANLQTGAATVVGISDCAVVRQNPGSIITYALGSCIAVSVYDPVMKVGGLLHFMLPESSLDPDKARLNPCQFGDTGIPLLLEQVKRQGAANGRLEVVLAGGARVLDETGVFGIGKRNYAAARKCLWKAGLLVKAEAVGGEVSRTVRLEISTGRVLVRESAGPERPIGASGGGAERSVKK